MTETAWDLIFWSIESWPQIWGMPKYDLMSNLHLNLSNAHLFLLQKGNQICTIFFCQDCTFFCQINTFFQYRNEPNRKKWNPSNSQEKKRCRFDNNVSDLTTFRQQKSCNLTHSPKYDSSSLLGTLILQKSAFFLLYRTWTARQMVTYHWSQLSTVKSLDFLQRMSRSRNVSLIHSYIKK